MNHVSAGDYANGFISSEYDKLIITMADGSRVLVNAKTVRAYEVVNEDSQKSLSSGIARGLVGGALLGGVGAIAGAATAKSKDSFQVAVEFMDGKKSLFELDGKTQKDLTRILFDCGKSSPEEAAKEVEDFTKSGKNKKKGVGCLVAFLVVAVIILVLLIALVKA